MENGSSKQDVYRVYGDKRRAAHQFRELRTTEILEDGRAASDGGEWINFPGNCFLGLTKHPELVARVQEAAAKYCAGSTASRLVTGNNPLYEKIETRLA